MIFSILKNNFKRKISKKSNFIFTFIIPICVVILGIIANVISKPSFTIGIINSSSTSISKQVIKSLKSTLGLEVKNAFKTTMQTDIITGRYSAIIEFSNSGFKINSVKDKQTVDRLYYLVQKYMEQPAPINIENLFDTAIDISQRICAFTVLFLMITATINASIITKDKNNKTFYRIKYSPCSTSSYILGNILFNFIITYFQFLISVSVIELFNLSIGISYKNYIVMGIWIVLFAVAFGSCMASLFYQEMQVNLFAACIALILSLIGGSFIALDRMPYLLQQFSIISPIRWFIESINIIAQGQSWFSNIIPITIISAMIVIFFIITVVKNRD